MANTIIPKRSSVAGKVPLTTDLQVGEIAINLVDGLIFTKNAGGTVISLGGGGGLPIQSGNAGKFLSTDGTTASWAALTSSDVTTALGYTPYNATNPSGYITSSALTPYLTSATAASTYQTALGYTPANKAGDTFTGKVVLPAATTSIASLNAPHGTAPTTPVNGDIWTTTAALFARINGATQQLATLATAQTWTANQTFSNSIYANSDVYLDSSSAGLIRIGNNLGAGNILIGSSTQWGGITLGQSTDTHTLNIDSGATASGKTKTINFGGNGVSGSTTTINIGSSVSGATTNVNTYGTWTHTGTLSLGSTQLALASGGTGANSAAGARTNLGLVIGTNVQAWDADLDAIAALTGTSGILKKTAANTWTLDTSTYLTGNETVTISGDASGSGATSISLTLANSGVAAGTYTKVTVDAKGRVTTGASLASADLPTYTGTLTSSQVTTALGYTPYNSTNPNGYTSNTGTVTSVGLSLPAIFSVTGSPVTTSGTLSASLASQTANTFFAAPSGSAGAPSFRTLVAADIPALTLENLPDAWVKRAVRCATTANITLSGTQTIDGIAVVAGDRVLVKDQTTASQNGLYVVAAGAWTRSLDADSASELAGAHVSVDLGTANGGLVFDTDFKSTDTVGTTAVTWSRVIDTGYLTTVGNNLARLTNPSAVTFLRVNADNTVSALDAATFRSAIGAGTSSTTGTVTSVGGTGTVSGLTLTGTVTSSGNLTLGGTLSVTPSNFASQTANTVLAAPNGSAGTPTFRALVAEDIPALTLEKLPDAWVKRSVKAATTANLTVTATTTTLTNSGTLAALVLDGVTLAANDRVLVKDQTTTAQNGVYVVTNVGSTSVAWVLTRAADADTTSELAGAMVNVDQGTANAGLVWDCDLKSTDTLGTSAVIFNRVLDRGYLTTVGNSLATLTNPSAIAFLRVNADNTVSALDAATFRTAIGAGTSSTTGTVTSVSGTGTVSGLTLSGTVTGSGSITLGGTLSLTSSQVTTALGYTPLSNGGGALTGTISVATSGSSSATSAVRIIRSGQAPASFGSYSGSWRSALEIWSNDSARMLFLTSGETDFGYGILKSVGAGFTLDVGSGGVTRAMTVETTGATNFPVGLQQGGNQVLHAGNYTSYSPSLTGSGASGTWGISISGTATTATTANGLNTANSYQVSSLGVGTAASGTAGEIRATNNITAYYSSDVRFKENIQDIPNALDTVLAIGGQLFDWKDDYIAERGGQDGYFVIKQDFGVIAQNVLAAFPRAVRVRPDGSLAVDYEKLSALSFAAIREQQTQIAEQNVRIKRLEALVEKLIGD